MRLFSEDLIATKTAKILGFNRKTFDRYYGIFQEKIMMTSVAEMNTLQGEFELDGNYFGAKRVREKRGRGAAGKTPVFGLLKKDGKVFITVVKDCSKAELMPIIKGEILEGSTIYTDS